MVPRPILVAATTAWIGLVAVGQGMLIRYALTPGRGGEVPFEWPAGTPIDHAPDRYTLVVAAHPRCPCTRASISELAVLVSRCRGRVAARVLFVRPPGFTGDWAQSDLWRMTLAIPEAEAILDHEGREARRFGAFTSGQVALYDSAGRLAFSGGLTGARGEIGANAGESAILALVGANASAPAWTPVYGCALDGPVAKQSTAGRDPSCSAR